MKVVANDLGKCGVCQMFYAGTVSFDTTGISEGVAICEIPKNLVVVGATAVVKTAFNAATTNVLTVGKTKANANEILGANDVTEGTTGAYTKKTFVEMGAVDKVYAKYTQTGTAATAGKAEIYLEVVATPGA